MAKKQQLIQACIVALINPIHGVVVVQILSQVEILRCQCFETLKLSNPECERVTRESQLRREDEPNAHCDSKELSKLCRKVSSHLKWWSLEKRQASELFLSTADDKNKMSNAPLQIRKKNKKPRKKQRHCATLCRNKRSPNVPHGITVRTGTPTRFASDSSHATGGIG